MDFDRRIYDNEPTKSYFLLVSANRFEKNAYRAVKALDALFAKKLLKTKRVVVIGCTDPSIFGKIKNRDMFEFLPYISGEKLEEYFYNAFLFIFPSLNEGFGYPPLMAMKYGVPVIASASSSIPEVCSDAALYFEPRSIGEIANRILQITYNKGLYKPLANKGLKRVEEFKIYQQENFLKVLREVFG
jgi:glycosyltransferase involved in cell wall biosynthesis